MNPPGPPASVPAPSGELTAVGVSIVGLRKQFGDLLVLKNITLEIAPGEIFVLMGGSGSGKTVLLKHLIGLEIPTAGRVTVGGLDPAETSTRDTIRMALVFQAGALFNSLSVYDNLAFYPREHRLHTEAGIRDRVMGILQVLSLEKAAHKFPSELSGGMRKRVGIARALVMEPQILLYDEPTSELDPVMAATISEMIATLRHTYHVTSVVVSHDRYLALNIADRIGVLIGGELAQVAPPAAYRNPADPRINEFFNPKIDVHHPRFKELTI